MHFSVYIPAEVFEDVQFHHTPDLPSVLCQHPSAHSSVHFPPSAQLSPVNPQLPLTSDLHPSSRGSSRVQSAKPISVTPGRPSRYKQSPKRHVGSPSCFSGINEPSSLDPTSRKALASPGPLSSPSKCKLLHNGIRTSLSSATVFLPGPRAEPLPQ